MRDFPWCANIGICQNMANAFQHIDSEGHLSNKAKFVTGITSDKLVMQPYGLEDVESVFMAMPP
jgi:hypothetical protein